MPLESEAKGWIGKVVSPRGTATLGEDGVWKADDPDVETYLNAVFDPDEARGLGAVLPYGRHSVSEAAVKLRGTAVFGKPLPPLEEGVIS